MWIPVTLQETEKLLDIWLPPTPPRTIGDKYLETFTPGYHTTVMPESALPPVHIKSNRPKRPKLMHSNTDGGIRPIKQEESIVAPRSMFERLGSPVANQPKIKKEIKLPPKCSRLPRGGMLISIGRGSASQQGHGGVMGTGKAPEEPWLDWNSQEETLVVISRVLVSNFFYPLNIDHIRWLQIYL